VPLARLWSTHAPARSRLGRRPTELHGWPPRRARASGRPSPRARRRRTRRLCVRARLRPEHVLASDSIGRRASLHRQHRARPRLPGGGAARRARGRVRECMPGRRTPAPCSGLTFGRPRRRVALRAPPTWVLRSAAHGPRRPRHEP
jgi:hypothetical protein